MLQYYYVTSANIQWKNEDWQNELPDSWRVESGLVG